MKKIFLGLILIFLVMALVGLKVVSAEESGIQISPPIFNLEINPGEKLSEKIIVTNRTNTDMAYVLEV